MRTPPMLRARDTAVHALTGRLDGVSAITVLLLVGCAVGLLVAGYLAVYDYATPSSESPLVTAIAAIFGGTLAINVLAAGVRALLRRRRPGG